MYCTVYYLEFCLRGFFVGVADCEIVLQLCEVCAVEIIAELMEFCHYVDVCQRLFVACQLTQGENVLSRHTKNHD